MEPIRDNPDHISKIETIKRIGLIIALIVIMLWWLSVTDNDVTMKKYNCKLAMADSANFPEHIKRECLRRWNLETGKQ